VRAAPRQRFFAAPWRDFLDALHAALPVPEWRGIAAAMAGTLVSWWIYVPVHELLHVLGCVATGGTVERLELSPEYGAAWLAMIFPFVAVGSDYAGQLVGFDTRGSDLTYGATVFAPYVLTILVGVPLLREVGRRGRAGAGPCAWVGVAIPPAFAGFAGVVGDFYELGSIPTSRAAAALGWGPDPMQWRSDDLVLLAREFLGRGARPADFAGVLAGFTLGTLCAFATYWLGVWLHRRVVG